MNCDHDKEHGRSPIGSKSSFREDDPQVHSVPSVSTFQSSGKTFPFSFNSSQRKRATNNVIYLFYRVIWQKRPKIYQNMSKG